jgi:UDP-N-acetylglucosamine--N-acetylmuramyl-(pentapeptide) pyrophosphoryl-undecaprenol N-acetylglucosamine transferase
LKALPRKLNRALLEAPGRLRDSVLAAGAVLDRVRAEVVVGVRLAHATAIGIPLRPAITGLDRPAHPTRTSSWPGTCSPRSRSDG